MIRGRKGSHSLWLVHFSQGKTELLAPTSLPHLLPLCSLSLFIIHLEKFQARGLPLPPASLELCYPTPEDLESLQNYTQGQAARAMHTLTLTQQSLASWEPSQIHCMS